MEIEQSILNYLESFLSCSVYPGYRPQKSVLPAVSLIRTSGGYNADLAGAISFTTPYFDVVIYSNSISECISISEQVREKLQGFSGTLSTREICFAILTDESDNYYKPIDNKASGIFETTQTYQIIHPEN